jgi:hypothetical protein
MSSTDPPRNPSPPDSDSFVARVEHGWQRSLEHLPLAVVPLISSLLAVDNVRRVLEFRGAHFGLTLRFPTALPDLWSFVSVPSEGPGVHVSLNLFLLPVLILVQSVLVAGLLGSVFEILRTGEYDFPANAKRYFAPVLVYEALVGVVSFTAFGVAVATGPLALLLVPAFLVLSYLFYATPYLLVVADDPVGEALARSLEWALAGGPYFAYGAGYLLFVAVVSVVGTAVVVNLGAVGILLGAVVSAPVGLALTFATTGFVAQLADDAGVADGTGVAGDTGTAGGAGADDSAEDESSDDATGWE